MWEYFITAPINKVKCLTAIYDNLEEKIKELNGVITLSVNDHTAKLNIGVGNKNKSSIKGSIINQIAGVIIAKYKPDYLKSNFNFKVNDDINMQAFLKALVVFDSDIDKQIIVRELMTCNKGVVLDSFFNFRLNILKIKWKDLINLANDNIMYLMTSDTFIELLKFLISNLDYRISEVNIFFSNSGYQLKDSTGKDINDNDNYLTDCKDCKEAFLITTLISLSPQKIKLHCKTDFKSQTLNLLFSLFNDRIEICN